MTAIFSLKCRACGRIHRVRGETQPETLDQLAVEAVRAGWGFRMDQDRLALFCSFACGQDAMPAIDTLRNALDAPQQLPGGLIQPWPGPSDTQPPMILFGRSRAEFFFIPTDVPTLESATQPPAG
jgi:hypothetical protein